MNRKPEIMTPGRDAMSLKIMNKLNYQRWS